MHWQLLFSVIGIFPRWPINTKERLTTQVCDSELILERWMGGNQWSSCSWKRKVHVKMQRHDRAPQEWQEILYQNSVQLIYPETWRATLILLPHPPHLSRHQLPSLFDTTFKVKVKVTQSCLTLSTPWTINSPWNSPGQNTGVGSLSLLQRISPNQGLNPGLLHCRQILYQLSHQVSWSDIQPPRLQFCYRHPVSPPLCTVTLQ